MSLGKETPDCRIYHHWFFFYPVHGSFLATHWF